MWSELERALRDPVVIAHGATEGWAAWLAAQLAARSEDVPLVVVVVADDAAARRLEADVRFFHAGAPDPALALDDIAVLPAIDVSPYADLSPDRGALVDRVATLYRLAGPALRPRIPVASA